MNQDENCFHVSETAGFTIVEVMIVLAIFSIGILGAMTMQTRAINLNTGSQKNSLAVAYATDTMEQLLRLPAYNGLDDDGANGVDDSGEAGFLDLAADPDPGDSSKQVHRRSDAYDSDGDSTDDLPADTYYDKIFNLTWTVTDVAPPSPPPSPRRVKRIAITVTWNGGTKQHMFTSYRINQ